MDWELVVNETVPAGLLPDVYAKYHRPLKEALKLFLGGLSERRQESIFIEQAKLPAISNSWERLIVLARSCPVLHKLGQTLARDRNFSSVLKLHLQQLESLPPSIPIEIIESELTKELGQLDRLGIKLMPPLAEASVAIVVPFYYTGGKTLPGGVFKLLKPGIKEQLEEELVLLEKVGSVLDQRCDDLKTPYLNYRETFEQVRGKLQYEVQLDKEQQNLSLARELYSRDSRVRIPALIDFGTDRITAMEMITGQKVTECCHGSWSEKVRMARLAIEALIARPIFSKEVEARFHGDPHAGNLFATNDNRLAILDWSLTGSLGEEERISLVQIMLGAMVPLPEKIIGLLSGLSKRRITDPVALRSVVYKWIDHPRELLPGITWLVGLLDEAARDAGLCFGPDLMLFRRVLRLVENVVIDLGGGKELIDKVLLSEFVLHLSAELPWRFISPSDSRAFATRVSNLDLFELLLSGWKKLLCPAKLSAMLCSGIQCKA